MIRISQLKLQPNHTEKDLICKIVKTLRINQTDILEYQIKKQSIDARKKPELMFVYTVDVKAKQEKNILIKVKSSSVSLVNEKPYHFHMVGTTKMKQRPIIIGTGPAGLFCAYMLAEHGYRPIVFERGSCVEERAKDIETFWETGLLKPNSNVQFGEGGAGTFSDGKLNTLVKDPVGRNHKVLQIFVENGAPEDILYINKPHIGTDILIDVVRNMREKIIKWGGEIHFNSQFIDYDIENGCLTSITVKTKDGTIV